MIILLILILTLGLVGVNIRDIIRQQRFKSEVSFIVERLRLAQDLMLMLNTDAIVRFAKDRQGQIHTSIELESILPKGWHKELNRNLPPFNSIRIIEFEDAVQGANAATLPIDLRFFSGGSVMSQGMLHLATQDRSQEAYICLSGYPRPINSIADPKNETGCNFNNQADFADKLTFYTRREIEDKQQKEALQGTP